MSVCKHHITARSQARQIEYTVGLLQTRSTAICSTVNLSKCGAARQACKAPTAAAYQLYYPHRRNALIGTPLQAVHSSLRLSTQQLSLISQISAWNSTLLLTAKAAANAGLLHQAAPKPAALEPAPGMDGAPPDSCLPNRLCLPLQSLWLLCLAALA